MVHTRVRKGRFETSEAGPNLVSARWHGGQRGFDHAAFCLLAPMCPNADIPVVQLGLRGDLDSDAHLRGGPQLAPLRDED
jgi:aromatic ring-opening dioxygenase catalytic subunit (LigB family)